MNVNEIPEIGKISPQVFNELIFPRLGAKSEKVLVDSSVPAAILKEEGYQVVGVMVWLK